MIQVKRAAALVNGIGWNIVNMAIAVWLLQRMRRRALGAPLRRLAGLAT